MVRTRRCVGALVLAVAVLAGTASSRPAEPATVGSVCPYADVEETTVIIDGELYGMIRAPGPRYVFGWSGKPALDFPEAFRLVRLLGLKGSDRELFALLSRGIRGADYSDGGSIGYFYLRCPGTYRAVVVVRGPGAVPATRIWLHEELHGRVVRSFCMPGQWIWPRARLAVRFTAPLSAKPPTFEIDRNGDGRIDRRGTFRRGGAAFPSRVRC